MRPTVCLKRRLSVTEFPNCITGNLNSLRLRKLHFPVKLGNPLHILKIEIRIGRRKQDHAATIKCERVAVGQNDTSADVIRERRAAEESDVRGSDRLRDGQIEILREVGDVRHDGNQHCVGVICRDLKNLEHNFAAFYATESPRALPFCYGHWDL